MNSDLLRYTKMRDYSLIYIYTHIWLVSISSMSLSNIAFNCEFYTILSSSSVEICIIFIWFCIMCIIYNIICLRSNIICHSLQIEHKTERECLDKWGREQQLIFPLMGLMDSALMASVPFDGHFWWSGWSEGVAPRCCYGTVRGSTCHSFCEHV